MTTDEIFAARLANRSRIPGARVGDFVRLPRVHSNHPEFTRITHDWGDTLQTGGDPNSSNYLCDSGQLSYSGGLDPGLSRSDLIATDEMKDGSVWIFADGIAGAHRGVHRDVPMRVFTIKPGADISGLHEFNCKYWLCCLNERQHGTTCGYWYTITKHGMSFTAFPERDYLLGWMDRTGVVPGSDIPAKRGEHASIRLHYADDIRLVRVGNHYALDNNRVWPDAATK